MSDRFTYEHLRRKAKDYAEQAEAALVISARMDYATAHATLALYYQREADRVQYDPMVVPDNIT